MVKSLHGEVSPGASEDSSSVLAPVGTTCLEDAARIECVCVCVLEQKLTFPEVLPCMKAQAMTESQEERKACRPNAPKRRKSRAQCKLGKFSYESRMASLKRAKKKNFAACDCDCCLCLPVR